MRNCFGRDIVSFLVDGDVIGAWWVLDVLRHRISCQKET